MCQQNYRTRRNWCEVSVGSTLLFVLSCRYLTSSMTTQICLTHWMMASGVPEIVTARSVELGSMSPATWTWAPVDCRRQLGDNDNTDSESSCQPVLLCGSGGRCGHGVGFFLVSAPSTPSRASLNLIIIFHIFVTFNSLSYLFFHDILA